MNNAVSSSGDGSISAPYKTIQQGINQLLPGDMLFIRGDTTGQSYSDSFSFPISGTTAQRIVVKGYQSEKVIITGTAGSRLHINRDHWTFENLIVDQANISSDAIRVNGKHITFRNLEVRNGRREGFSIENAAFITIEDSYIHNFMWIDAGTRRDAHCIMIDTDRGPSISDIKILRNTIERCSGDGIQIFGVTGQSFSSYANNIEITDNTFIDGTSTTGLTENALDFKAGDTVLVKGNTMSGYKNNKTIVIQKGCRNIVVEGNILRDGLFGIEMRQEGGLSFIQENNSIIQNQIYDMSSYAMKFDGVRGLTVLNNTLVNIGSNAFRFESTLGATVPSVDGGVIKNNLMNLSGKPSVKSSFSNLDIGHNGWFQTSAGTLSSVTDTTGFDPLFVDPSTKDYHLQSASKAIDAGIPVGLSFTGTAPDLGAIEKNPISDTTPPSSPTGLKILS
ncbi:MAG: right-handed parallel beta-helix repeat-containing protein [Nitrospiria bacterium]